VVIASRLTAVTLSRADEPRPVVDVSVLRSPGLPVLEQRSGDAGWRTACVVPCTLRLSVADEYRIGGDGVVDSSPFRLPATDEHLRVEARGGSPLLRDVGTLLAVGGMAFAAGGGAILLLPDDANASSDARSSKVVVGIGFIAMGLLATTVGVLARLFSDTSVRVSVAP
jgi:hypothetical protein